MKDILKKNTCVEDVPQAKSENVKETIDQLNCDDGKISINNDKAFLKGDNVKIVEHDCSLCKKKFMNENNLKTHDVRYRMKNGTGKENNCDYCTQTYLDKGHLVSHITIQHKKCTLCDNIFPSEQDLETHMKAVHKRDKSKNSLAR